jgi:hypothetical protein
MDPPLFRLISVDTYIIIKKTKIGKGAKKAIQHIGKVEKKGGCVKR